VNLSQLRNGFLSLVTVSGLVGCTSVPLTSIVKLSSVNMGSTLPEGIRVAFVTPKILRVEQGDLFMNVHLKTGDGATDVQKKLDLLVDESAPPPSVVATKGIDDDIHILKLRPEDVALFKGLQKTVNETQQSGKKGSLDINFGSKACATREITEPLYISAFIKTSELSDFTLLLSRVNLMELAKEGGENPRLKICDK
jgi:hypothetical protein